MSLGCYMMVINGESTIERALSPLAGHIRELSVLDTGSTDGTVNLCQRLAQEVLHVPLVLNRISPETTPSLFIDDADVTFEGAIPGPFTGAKILAHWGNALSFALSSLSTTYGLRMDADDVIEGASGLSLVTDHMDSRRQLNIAKVPYDVYATDGSLCNREYMPKLVRVRSVYWDWPLHEQLFPREYNDEIHVRSGILVKDMNDSPGKIRIAHRNAKVLYHHYLQALKKHEIAPPAFVMTVGHEMVKANPILASKLLQSIDLSVPSADNYFRADVLFHLGLAFEKLNHPGLAAGYYDQVLSLEERPNALARRAIVRMACDRSRFIGLAAADVARAEMLALRSDNLGVYLPWLREARAVLDEERLSLPHRQGGTEST